MKALVTVLVVAAAVAAFFLVGGGDSFAVTGSQPLGSFDAIDSYLVEKGLKKKKVDQEQVDRVFGRDVLDITESGEAYTYMDKVSGYKTYSIVVTNGSGKVIAVGAKMRSGTKEFSKMGSKTETFIAAHWIAVAGGPPKLETKYEDVGVEQQYRIGTFSKGRTKGVWRKDPGGATLDLPHQISDRVTLISQ